jgi:hypothetical protein
MYRLGPAAVALLISAAVASGVALAADHGDVPAVEPAADITNLLAWMAPDAGRLQLVMTVYPDAPPGARFSADVRYVYHTGSRARPDFLVPDDAALDVICVFDAAGIVSCWAGDRTFVQGR